MTPYLPWAGLALLLCLSAFFSASETALFSLGPEDRQRSGGRVRRLLADPRAVLVSILLANLLANLLFFVTARALPHAAERFGELVTGFGALIAILVLGEILPKTLALRAPRVVATLTALPLSIVVVVLTPARGLITAILDRLISLIGEADRVERGITAEALAKVLEHSAAEGLLAPGEADLLAEIVELEGLRVREIMTPRVDALFLDLEDDAEERAATLRAAQRQRLTWLPVVQAGPDNVLGLVQVRDLLAQPDRPVEQLVMPVKFVPEVASGLALLHTMHEDRIAEAVVVDEWGGTAGIVTLEDLFEELVGELRVEGEDVEKPVVPLGEGRFRVQGGLAIRDWNEHFGMRVVPTEFETVGGYVTALLGRIPRSGDRVRLGGGLVCEIDEVRGRRIVSMELYVEPDEARELDT